MAKRKRASTTLNGAALLDEALLRYESLLSPQEYAHLLDELKQPLYSAIRFNTLKVDPLKALEYYLQTYGWQLKEVPFSRSGWWVVDSGKVSIGHTIEHRLGDYYIQDAASMLPVELFDLRADPDQLVLDLAASPGGKTTHLVSRTNDMGLVMANDASQDRITALRLVLQSWGAANVAVTHFPGEKIGGWFPETFDRILLDAPCSMENLRSTESHPMRAISPHERLNLAVRQERLLASAFQALKVGGQLVYSTCTLAPEEDEGVLDGLLKRYPGAVCIESLENRLPQPAPGLSGDGSRVFNPSVTRAARLWPHLYGTSGFFAALISKLGPVETFRQLPPNRPFKKTGLEQLSRSENARLVELFAEEYGFDLMPVLDKQRLQLWKRAETIYAIPETFLSRFSDLPFQALGLQVGEETPDGFSPSHNWVARFGSQFKLGLCPLQPEQVQAWLHGEDLQGRFLAETRKGKTVIVLDEQGRLLGRAKLHNGRLKNLLPRRLAF
jgi:16S rRNA (cytosine1407-C5)-methyltransferase